MGGWDTGMAGEKMVGLQRFNIDDKSNVVFITVRNGSYLLAYTKFYFVVELS